MPSPGAQDIALINDEELAKAEEAVDGLVANHDSEPSPGGGALFECAADRA